MKAIQETVKFKVFETVPDLYLILSPDLFILNASNAYLESTSTQREKIIGKFVFDVFTPNPEAAEANGISNLRFSLEEVLKNKMPHTMEIQRYEVKKNNGEDFVFKYYKPVNIPVLNSDHEIEYIIHKVEDITKIVQQQESNRRLTTQTIELIEEVQLTRKQVSHEKDTYYELFDKAPTVIAILKGPDLIYEFANPKYLQVVGRSSEIIGKSVREVFPELIGHDILDILDNVYRSGKEYKGYEFLTKIDLNNDGFPEDLYFNFVYQPFHDVFGNIQGVLAHGVDVTDLVQSRKVVEESEKKYRTLFNTIDQGFCILEIIFDIENRPVDYRFLEVNPVFEKQTGLKDATGKTARELLPDLESKWFEIYGKIALTGESIRFSEGSDVMQRWFDVYAFRVGNSDSHKVALLFTDITERKLSEKTLKENEERLSRIVEGSNDGIWDWDYKNDFAWWNERYTEILGIDIHPSERGLKKLREYIHPDDLHIVPQALKAHLEEGKPYEAEFRIVRPSGEIRYVLTKGKGVKDAHGTVTRLSGIITDLTERKKTEIAYRKAEARRKRIEQSNIAGVFYWNIDGTISDCNDAFLEMIGYSREELASGKISLKVLTPEEFTESDEQVIERELLPTGQYIGYEKQFIHKDGSRIEIYMSGAFLEDSREEGVAVVLDITERKRYEQTLRESEERFHNLADTAPIFMVMADETGQAIYFNKPWLEWTGRSMDEMLGLKWLVTLHPEDAPKFENDFKKAFQKQQSIHQQYRFRKADGEYRWMLAVGAPRYTPDGKFVGYFGTYTDFHELKQTQDDLTQKNEQLTKINNDLDNFIYTASHDLKAPMSNIEGILNSLRDKLESEKNTMDEEIETLLHLMEKSIDRFKGTILDLTEITKVQKSFKEDVKEIHFSEITEDVRLSVLDKIRESEGIITTDFSSTDTIRFSRKNLKSIIYNLLSNAIKYRDKTRPLEISIKTEKSERFTILSIQDNGLGISEKNRPKMFSMFKRFHDHVEGTGIGLYIIKRIIDNAGGKIDVESKIGEGTVFRIFFKNN